MKIVLILGLSIVIITGAAKADKLEDAYNAGYDKGKKAGYREGSAACSNAARSGSRTTPEPAKPAGRDPGTSFAPISDESHTLGNPDSGITIFSNKAVGEIEERLGKDFLRDNAIVLNNRQIP